MKTITSSANPLFKEIKSLLDTKGVKKFGKSICFGSKAISDFVSNHAESIESVVKTDSQRNIKGKFSTLILSEPLFKQLDIFNTKEPFIIFKTPQIKTWSMGDCKEKDIFLLLPFQDPGNLGTCLRTAAAFGIRKILLTTDSAHPFSAKVNRAASATHLDLEYFISKDLVFNPIKVMGLDAGGEPIQNFSENTPFILAPGIEGKGLYEKMKYEKLFSIPIKPDVESLNASIATSIALYEISKKYF